MSAAVVLFLSMTWIVNVISTESNSFNIRRLLTTNNGSTTTVETSQMESTVFYVTKPMGQHANGPQIINDLMYNHLYQIIVGLALTQLIALCCLILYCHKQRATTKQIRDLSDKIDDLITANKVTHSINSAPSLQSNLSSANSALSPVRSRTNTMPVTAATDAPMMRVNSAPVVDSYRPHTHELPSNPSNSPPTSTNGRNYGYRTPNQTVPTAQYNPNQYTPVSPPNQAPIMSFSNDNEPQRQTNRTSVRPWSPKRGNQTCLPPAPKQANNNFNNNMNHNQAPHPTEMNIAHAVYNMRGDDTNALDEYRNRESVWSNAHDILMEQNASVMTVGTRHDSVNDSVLGEMLGLNVRKRTTKINDVDIILEIVESDDEIDEKTKENTLLITDDASYQL
eukprot:211053_1